MISLYQDIMISFMEVFLNNMNKETRTKQVQFRMDPDIFKKLKAAVALDDEVYSMADLFNKAAYDYLKEKNYLEDIKLEKKNNEQA